MTVDLKQPILTFEGKTQKKEGTEELLILKDIVGLSLSQFRTKEDTKEIAYSKYVLSKKVNSGEDTIEITPEEAVLIKDCVFGIGYDNNTVGRVFDLVEGK